MKYIPPTLKEMNLPELSPDGEPEP